MKLHAFLLVLLFCTIPVTADAHPGVSIQAASGNSSGSSALFASSPQNDRYTEATTGPEAAPKQFLLLLLGEGLIGAVFFLRRKVNVCASQAKLRLEV